MGLFSTPKVRELIPCNPPLGINTNYCMPHPTTLVMREKVFSFSGDDFYVQDTNGQTVVKIKGQALSFRDRKTVTDPNGNPLFGLRNKMFSIPSKFVGESPDGAKEMFSVRNKFSMKAKIEVTFINAATNQPTALTLTGDFFGFDADIILPSGQCVAQISRQYLNSREIFGHQQTYYVTVAPGVDLSLIAAICVCFDEVKNEKK